MANRERFQARWLYKGHGGARSPRISLRMLAVMVSSEVLCSGSLQTPQPFEALLRHKRARVGDRV